MVARVTGIRSGEVRLAAVSHAKLPQLERVHLRFDWNRTRFRRAYAAHERFADTHHALYPALFEPGALPACVPAVRVGDFACFDERLSSQQRAAVAAVLSAVPGGPAVLLVGAAGSGKTETIVEMVRQALRQAARGGATRVLVCAPSNGAADVLALRLLAADRNIALLRLNSPQRSKAELLGGDALYSVCVYDSSGVYAAMPASMEGYSVVVSTCTTSGWLQEVHRNQWVPSLIIIDEAAQAMEAEALIPLAMAQRDTRIVLCGDPAQLGPAVRSRDCLRLGEPLSLLERLATDRAYAEGLASWKVWRIHLFLFSLALQHFCELFLAGHAEQKLSLSSRAHGSERWPVLQQHQTGGVLDTQRGRPHVGIRRSARE